MIILGRGEYRRDESAANLEVTAIAGVDECVHSSSSRALVLCSFQRSAWYTQTEDDLLHNDLLHPSFTRDPHLAARAFVFFRVRA